MRSAGRHQDCGSGSVGLRLRPAVALATALLAGSAAAADEGGSRRYLESAGAVYTWDGLSTDLVRVPDGTPPAGPGVRRVLPPDGDRLLILASAGPEAFKGRHPREGEARLFDLAPPSPRLLKTIPFEGEPLDGVLAPDAPRAWVLALRPPAAPDQAPRTYLHTLDLEAGRVEETTTQTSPAAAIALDLEGRRLFASQKDRIQSFTLRPLIPSWHLRSPGDNRALAILPGTGTICVVRGEELALFDPAEIARRDPAARRAREDDASGTIRLPFEPDHLVLSADGRLALLSGPGHLAFVDPLARAVIWPGEPIPGMREAAGVRSLTFAGRGADAILALMPAGAVVAVRTPALSGPEPAPPPPAVTAPAAPPPAVGPAVPPEPAAATPPMAATASPTAEPPAREESPPPASPPAPSPEPAAAVPAAPTDVAGAATLSGHVSGAVTLVRAIVLFGPNSIIREFGRVRPEADGSWSVPLPPPGSYRLVPIGNGSTPLPVTPGFLTVKVEAGTGRTGLDFEVRGTP